MKPHREEVMKESISQSIGQSSNSRNPPESLEPVVDAGDDDEHLVIDKRIPRIGRKFDFER